jgi:hypothetical protein
MVLWQYCWTLLKNAIEPVGFEATNLSPKVLALIDKLDEVSHILQKKKRKKPSTLSES